MQKNKDLKFYDMSQLENVHVYGRTGSQKMPLPLFWTGSGVELLVDGSELWVELETDYDVYEPWISVEINGAWIGRQMVTEGRKKICIFRNMDKATAKRVRIFRDVQAMSGDATLFLLVHGFYSDGKFLPVLKKSRKMEFIGDSITSGEGSIGATEELDWISMWFTAMNDYALLTANRLDADFHICSQSGWGVVSSWDNNPNCALPDFYEQVCGLCGGAVNEKAGAKEAYDFSSWQADYVVINLGTNDDGACGSPEWVNPDTGETFKQHKEEDGTYREEDVERFVKKSIRFLTSIREKNPNTYILWAYGMLGTPLMPVIEKTVAAYKKETGDERIEVVPLPEAVGDGVGARSHPGVGNHRQAADILVEKVLEIESKK